MSEIILRVAVKAVIVNNNRILVLREASTYDEGTKSGRYQLVGGRINPGEPLLDNLRREVKEETGITNLTINDPILVGEWLPVIKGIPHHIVGIFYACQASSELVKLSEEHDAYLWLAKDEVPSYDIVQPDKQAAEKLGMTLPGNNQKRFAKLPLM